MSPHTTPCVHPSPQCSSSPYKIVKDPEFVKWKAVKQYVMKKSKEAGMGRLEHQAGSLTVSEINFLFQHDTIDVWTGLGLQKLLLLFLTTTYNYRVEREIRRITFGIYFSFFSVRMMV